MTEAYFDKLYEDIESLRVDMGGFTTDVGFPFLQQKLVELSEKRSRISDLSVKVLRARDLAIRSVREQAVLYDVTQDQKNLEASKDAKLVLDRLTIFEKLLKVRKDALRESMLDIRLYVRIVEDALESERTGVRPDPKATRVLPVKAQEDRMDRAEDFENLFG